MAKHSISFTVALHQKCNKVTIEEDEIEKPSPTFCTSLHAAILDGSIDACRREVHNDKSIINTCNSRGDSPLHLAVRWITQVGVKLAETLMSAGANINVRNKWGQTPLHYAVFVESIHNVSCLLAHPGIDVNVTDVNGYTPLHCCFRFQKDSEKHFHQSTVFLDIAEKLIDAGADTNAQTEIGDTILHLIARRTDNTPLLQFVLKKYSSFILFNKNKKGENFLHVYATAEIFEIVMETIEFVAKNNSHNDVKTLLRERNINGRSPWEHMVDSGNIDDKSVTRLIEFGVDVSVSDNLKNTALHRLAGVSSAIAFNDVLNVLVKENVNINFRNIFGESAVFLLFLESVFEVLVKSNADFNAKDRWNRSPLISIMKHRPLPELLRRLIVEGNADVNAVDETGSTPLHFAACHNYEEQVELLLCHGANIFAVDHLNDRPIHTAQRHCSFQCHRLLALNESQEILYSRSNCFDWENIHRRIPECIPISEIRTKESIQRLTGLPENRSEYLNFLMDAYGKRQPEHEKEVFQITEEVSRLVHNLCRFVASYDKRFQMTVFRTGSSEEGTKVGPPDEFDFALCIGELRKITRVVMTKECVKEGYACLKFKQNPVPNEYLQFSDCEGYFLSIPFLKQYHTYLNKALNEVSLWTEGNMYCKFEDKMHVIHGKPVFNFEVYWIGSVYKQLKISIDLVPVVYTLGWWPKNIYPPEVPEMDEMVRQAGCFLILQSRVNDFDTNKIITDDDIFETCNNDRNKKTKRMLRVSAAPAEIALMKVLPDPFRSAYIIAKLMKNKDVCPQIDIDKLPTKMLSLSENFSRELPINPSRAIKSYMLKNCTFYLWLEMQASLKEGEVNSMEIAARIYESLLKFTNDRFLSPFFLPYSDVFEFEKDDQMSPYKEFLLRLKREFSIKTILGMLNHDFPEHCLSSPA